MINDLQLRMETSYRRGECIGSLFHVPSSWKTYALFRNTLAALTRALKIYHLARGAFYIVSHYACRIASSNKLGQTFNAQLLREAGITRLSSYSSDVTSECQLSKKLSTTFDDVRGRLRNRSTMQPRVI